MQFHSISAFGQERKVRERKSVFQVSLFPGISTNGIRSGSFKNQFSINLFGGLAGGNGIFEFSPVTNVNIRSTTGIQIAGLANITGANAFVNLTEAEERALMHDDFHVNAKGIQVAGLMNYVLNSGSGIGVAGLMNVVGDDFSGVQISSIGNSAGGYVIGLQFSGFYNIAKESISGVQISSTFNYTNGELSGTQIGLINKSRTIAGKKSTPPTSARGLQIGLWNAAKLMHGVQIGLINVAGNMRGKQIGLINFFSVAPQQERVRAGTPIGLFNFGSKGSYFRLQYNELYSANIEWSSGNCLNCSKTIGSEMPFDDSNQIFNQNELILGYDRHDRTWGFGYGFQKVLYNKVSIMPRPENKSRIISYGLKLLHLNRSSSFDASRNLLARLNLDYGKRYRGLYLMVGLSANYFLHELRDGADTYKIHSKTWAGGNVGGLASLLWPGYAFAIQF